MTSPPANSEKNPLNAAQKIVTELTGMTSEHQSLAIKFAIETLGLQLPTSPAPSVPPSTQYAPQAPAHATGGEHHATNIRSFTAMKAPKSDQQFTAVVAYFYQFEAKPEEKKDAIDADIMKEAARLAGRAQVARWNMTLTNAKNAGYLDSAGNGKFKLSSVGENLVAITLPGTGGPVQSKGRSTAKKIRKQKKAVKKR